MDIGNQCNKHNAKIELQTRFYTSQMLLLISTYDRKSKRILEFGITYQLRLWINFCMLFHVIIEQNKIGISLIFNFMKQY